MNNERLYELLDDVEDKHAEPHGKQRIELGEELLHKSAESHDLSTKYIQGFTRKN